MKRVFEILDHERWITIPGTTVLYRGIRCGVINRRQVRENEDVKVEVIFDETPGGRDIYERTGESWSRK